MSIYCYNYSRMNAFLQKHIQKEMKVGLSIETDPELYDYQCQLEQAVAKKFFGRHTVAPGSGRVSKGVARLGAGGYAIGTSSGTAALQFTLLSMGVGKGDQVITVPNTYIGTALGISNTGAEPVFVDVQKDTMLMDVSTVEDAIISKTKAIVPVHLFGQMCDMIALSKVAKKHGIPIIEDAAHAPLATFTQKPVGKMSAAAFYSFYPNKSLGAASNGGMVYTKKRSLFEQIEVLRNPLSDNPFLLKGHRTPGYLDWIQLVFIKIKLQYLAQWTKRRRQIAQLYTEELADTSLILPSTDRRAYHVFCNYVVRHKKRKALIKYLQKKHIQTAIHYPDPLHLTKTYQSLGYQKGDFPKAENICDSCLSLPLNPFLKNEEVLTVIRAVKSFCKNNT